MEEGQQGRRGCFCPAFHILNCSIHISTKQSKKNQYSCMSVCLFTFTVASWFLDHSGQNHTTYLPTAIDVSTCPHAHRKPLQVAVSRSVPQHLVDFPCDIRAMNAKNEIVYATGHSFFTEVSKSVPISDVKLWMISVHDKRHHHLVKGFIFW